MPFDLLRRAHGRPRFAWLRERTAWVGLGLRTAAVAEGEDRFQRLRWAARDLAARQGTAGPFFVGFGFTAKDHHPRPWWENFPAALAALPEEVHGPLALPLPSLPTVTLLGTPSLPSPLASPPRPQWEHTVSQALAAIAAGEFHKVVLARAEVLRFEAPLDPVTVLEALHRRHPTAFCFLFEPQPGVAFVGATPERLARVTPTGQVETAALAGTARRGGSPEEDTALGKALLHSEKDRREHAWVVEAIREALTPLAERLEIPAMPRLRRLPGLQHLETPIWGELRPAVGLLDVAAALHPTPALGGVPREAALRFIARHEPHPRGWYAAPVGIAFPDGTGELAVAIRSALLLGDQAVVFAGAGIVAGSDPAREWDETALKMTTMGEALAEAERLTVGRQPSHLAPGTPHLTPEHTA